MGVATKLNHLKMLLARFMACAQATRLVGDSAKAVLLVGVAPPPSALGCRLLTGMHGTGLLRKQQRTRKSKVQEVIRVR